MDYLNYAVYAALFIWNLVVFIMYGVDKKKAKNHARNNYAPVYRHQL